MLTKMGGEWYWVVPGRQVFCATFSSWVKQIVWCHVVLRWFQVELDGVREAGRYDDMPIA